MAAPPPWRPRISTQDEKTSTAVDDAGNLHLFEDKLLVSAVGKTTVRKTQQRFEQLWGSSVSFWETTKVDLLRSLYDLYVSMLGEAATMDGSNRDSQEIKRMKSHAWRWPKKTIYIQSFKEGGVLKGNMYRKTMENLPVAWNIRESFWWFIWLLLGG